MTADAFGDWRASFRRWVIFCLALALPCATLADVWAFIDEKGLAHFATSQLDTRYQLFAKVDDAAVGPVKIDNEPAARGGTDTSAPIPVGGNKKLLALFDISPDFMAVRHHLRQASQRHGVGFELLQALIATESGFDRNAVSPKGAVGLMQLMPATALRFGVSKQHPVQVHQRLLDPATNIDVGTRYLRYLMDKFPGDLELALAAYNAGEGAVARAGRKIPSFPETQNYVKTVRQLHHLLLGPGRLSQAHGLLASTGVTVAPAQASKTEPTPPNPVAPMMVPGLSVGRSNMVQSLSSRSGQVTFVIPAPSDLNKDPL